MSLFGKKRSNNDKKKSRVVTQEHETDEKIQNNEELIAIISAAIAAFESNKIGSNLVIRKIVREQGQVTVWNSAGRADCMRSRRV